MTISLISTTESTNFRNTTANKVTPTVSWTAGDLVMVWGHVGDNARSLTAPTVTGLTFTNRLTSNVASRTKLYLWTAPAVTSGSGAIASTLSASEEGGLVVKVYRGTGTLSLGTISSLGSGTTGTPQVAYTISATGSVVDGAWGNWNQNSNARTYRTTNLGTATEDDYYDSATFATVGNWHNASTTATGSQTVGLSAPTMNAWLCAAMEIVETGGGGGAQSISTAGAIASGEAIGSHTLTPGPVTVSPSGVASAEAFGTARLDLNVGPAGAIASAEAFGTDVITPGAVTVSPTGIASAEALGTPVVGGDIAGAGGIASAEAFGTPTISAGPVTISPAGIPSAEAFGSDTITGGVVLGSSSTRLIMTGVGN